MLSSAARAVWAKSLNGEGAWLPLWQHMDDAADIAGQLFDDWLPPAVAALIAEPFAGDRVAVRTAVSFLAGVHDVGKATPAFAIQDAVLAQRMRDVGLSMPATKAELLDRQRTPHALAGHHLLRRWLMEREWSGRTVAAWAVVVGGHHGVPPDSLSVGATGPLHYPQLYGEGLWADVQRELIDRVAARTGALGYLDAWRDVRLPATFQVGVVGLVILADWIASNESLLPFYGELLPEVVDESRRAAAAADRLSLPGPWATALIPPTVEELFATRFNFPTGALPRPVQLAACDVASEMPGPGLMIIEAPMGEGKTEAALAVAEILADRWGAGGVHVALPTQATTDAMFGRVIEWLDALGAGQQRVGAVTLSHGKAALNRVFQGMVQSGRSAEIGCDEDASSAHGCGHAVVAHAWLSGRKKSQLANFVVGTIDQLLFAGLKSRHLMLRHLALAGKVVVIDEVHAYDAFMNSYLSKVLTWLGAYRVPVVALSATLPADRRQALMNAYTGGLERGEAPGAPPNNSAPQNNPAYPLISWTRQRQVISRQVAASGRRTVVSVDALGGSIDHDFGALIFLLRDLLSDGGCALVIRNTVSRVLRAAAALSLAFPDEVTVAHSRFITADRLRRDEHLLQLFGPQRSGTTRPFRHIVVASQVVEQSLDVDFDVLITDLAPVDLVLQRMGRLHRHQRGVGQVDRPTKLQTARTFISGADFTVDPPDLERGAADFVYHRYPMLRAAAVLQPRFGGTIALPDDIAPLVQSAYGPGPLGPASWQATLEEQRHRWLTRIENRQAEASRFQISDPSTDGEAILGWVSGHVGESDDDAQGQGQVRDGEPSLEVMVVEQAESGHWRTPSWLPDGQGGLFVPRDQSPNNVVASVLLSCSLRLPIWLSTREVEEVLLAGTPQSWQQSKLIYRLPALVVDSRGSGQIGERAVRYTPEFGLEVLRS